MNNLRDIKWKLLAGIITESQFLDELATMSTTSVSTSQGPSFEYKGTNADPQIAKAAEDNFKATMDYVMNKLDDVFKQAKSKGNVSIQENVENAQDYDQDEDLVDLDMDDNFNYTYNTFQEFIDSKYGTDLSNEETVKAIEEWAAGYNVGQNPGDFIGVAEVATPEILQLLDSSDVSQIFVDELKDEMAFSAKEKEEAAQQDQNLNEVVSVISNLSVTSDSIKGIANKIGDWTGKKPSDEWIENVSLFLADKGKKFEQDYVEKIKTHIKTFFPSVDTAKLGKSASLIYLSLLGAFAVESGLQVETALKQFDQNPVGGLEGSLAMIKPEKVGEEIVKALPKILTSLGLFASGV